MVLLTAVSLSLSADGYQAYSDQGFPVISKTLSVGVEPARDIAKRIGVQPIFIIGSDQQSLSWAKSNSDYLRSKNAVGFLVEAQNNEHVEKIRQHLGFSALFLLPDDRDLAHQLAITHYPVFIDFAAGRVLQ